MADEVKKRVRALLDRDFPGSADIPSALSGLLNRDYPVSNSAIPGTAVPLPPARPVPPALPKARPVSVNVPVKLPSPLEMGDVIGEAPQKPKLPSPMDMGEVIGRAPVARPDGILGEVGNQLGRGWNRLQQAANVAGGYTGILSPEEMVGNIAANERDLKQYPTSEAEDAAMAEWEETDGFLPSLGVLVRNPQIITGTMFESLPQSVPSIIGGAAGAPAGVPGVMAGVATGSGLTEAASTLLDTFRESGVNVEDDKAVAAAFANPKLMAEAKRRAVSRGVAVGLFDGLTAGLGGKIGLSIARKLGAGAGAAGAAGIEAAGGAAGEASAQVADKGRVENWGDVALEGVAELPGGLAETGAAVLADRKGKTPATPAGPARTFTIRDPAIGGVPGSPLDGEQVTADPDQTGVRANMTRVVLPDGRKAVVGNRLLEPTTEEQNPETSAPLTPPAGDGMSATPVPPPPAGPVPSPTTQAQAPETPARNTPENGISGLPAVDPTSRAKLRAIGHDDADIDDMSPEEVAAELQIAEGFGVEATPEAVDEAGRYTPPQAGPEGAGPAVAGREDPAVAAPREPDAVPADPDGVVADNNPGRGIAPAPGPQAPLEADGAQRPAAAPQEDDGLEALFDQEVDAAAPPQGPAAEVTELAYPPNFQPLDPEKGFGPGRIEPPDASGNRRRRAAVFFNGEVFEAHDHTTAVDKAAEKYGADVLRAVDVSPLRHLGYVVDTPAGAGTRAAPVAVTTSADLDAARDQVAAPTERQKKAGNYKKGHARLYRMPVSIENPVGTIRTGTDEDGNAWESELPADYGYLKGTKDRTGEPIDFYVGPKVTDSDDDFVVVIDQFDPKTGKFDEPKVIFGTESFAEAHDLYDRAFADGSGPSRRLGSTGHTVAQFRQLLREKAIGFKPLDPATRKRAARRTREGKPVSAIRFVQGLGGIKGYKDEIKHLGLDRFPGLINEKKGMDADYVREALAEAGYFGGDPYEDTARTNLTDLWNLLTAKDQYAAKDVGRVLDMQTEDRREADTALYEERSAQVEAAIAAFEAEFGHPIPAGLRLDTADEMMRTGSLDVEGIFERISIYGVASYIDEHPDLYDADELAWWDGVRDEIVSEPVYDDIPGWDDDGDARDSAQDGPDDGQGGPLAEGERGDEGRGEDARDEPEVRSEGEGQARPVAFETVTLDGGKKGNQGLLFGSGSEGLGTAPKIRRPNQQDADFGLFAPPKPAEEQLDIEDAPAAEPERIEAVQARLDAAIERSKDKSLTFDQMRAAFKAANRERDKLVDLLAAEPGGLVMKARDGDRGAAVSRDSITGNWRVTWFDRDGFQGHIEVKDKAEGVREAMQSGFVDTDRGLLKAYMKEERWGSADRAMEEWNRRQKEAREEKAPAPEPEQLPDGEPGKEDIDLDALFDDALDAAAPSTKDGAGLSQKPTKAATKPARKAKPAEKPAPRRGKVGDMLSSGEVVLTATGRETTPFPKLALDTERKTIRTTKLVDRWLMENALAEAEARGDDFNARQFRANLDKPSQADKDSAELYLFDDDFVQPVRTSILKPLSRPDRTAGETAKDAVKSTVKGLDDVAKGLSALFGGPNKLGSGPSFDPETYARAKPFFLAGVAHFKDAATDIAQLMQKLVSYLVNEGGMSRDAIQAMKPYVVQFVRDVRDGTVNLDEGDVSGPRDDLEQGGDGKPENGDGAAPIRNAGRRSGGGSGGGRSGSRGTRRTAAGGGGVSDSGTAPVGGEGDQASGGEGRDGEPGAAGGGERGGSDQDRGEGLSIDDAGSDEAVAKAALVRAGLKGRAERDAAQKAADQIAIKPGIDNIRETLPLLSPEQQEDVEKAEESFKKRPGMLFTNGTGTGKTYSGAGVIKRFHRQGKTNILVVAPSQGILDAWKGALADLAIPAEILADTNSAGTRVTLTTYANLRTNDALIKRDFDLIVPDEAHTLSSNQGGDATQELETFRALTGHARGFYRFREALHPKLYEELRAVAKLKNPNAAVLARLSALADQLRDLEPADRIKWEKRGALKNKAVFLSATPFPYAESVDWAEGYLFDYGKEPDGRGYNQPSAQQAFMIQHFGYRMRTGKLTKPDAEVDSGVMEREFHEHLAREGALSGRELDVDKDYERRFVLEESAIGQQLDDVLKSLRESENGRYRDLYEIVSKNFDFLARRQLLEAINAEAAVPRIKKHLALGRKVVVFHGYNVGGGFNPFVGWDSTAKVQVIRKGSDNYQDKEEVAINLLAAEWIKANRDIADLDFSHLMPPVDALKEAFGDRAVIYNGTIPKKKRAEAKERFNQDGSGVDIIVVQIAAGEAGISLHDTTGKHRRVMMQIGMPTRPTSAIQTEGRIYRVGQESDALFEYLTTGTNWERYAFADTVAGRSGTAENLALGNRARTLKQSFIDAYQDADTIEPSDADGKGGKEKDRASQRALSPFDRARSLYFAQQRGRHNNLGDDYFATPEPLGFKMVEWAGIKRGEKILEPSAGHGAIARFFPEDTARTVVEWSTELASRLGLNAPGARVVEDRFENLHVSNKYDAIVMNPPFGMASKRAFEHIEKATTHLRNGGRLVALFPNGPAADKRLEAFQAAHPELYALMEVTLPAVTFERAGTGISARVVVWEKQTQAADADKLPYGRFRGRDLSSVTSIKELFDRLENIEAPDRVKPSVEERDLIQLAPLANEFGVGDVEAGGFTWTFGGVREPEPEGRKVLRAKKKLGERFRDAVARVEKLGGVYDRGGPAFMLPSIASMESFLNDIEANPLKTADELYSAATAEIAANRPPEAPVDRSAIPATLTFKPHKVFNRKQGRNQWVAEQSQRVETEAYRALEAMAKKHGGWFSSWAKDDAVPGWQFKTEEGRDNFTADVAAIQRGRLAQVGTSRQTETPAFKAWFGDSKVIRGGKPLVVYHGTSKDADFKAFKVPRNGAWFTPSTKEASSYAQDNDSTGYKFDYDSGRMLPKNTAARVLPVYLSIQNPKVYDRFPEALRYATNYKRAQAELFDVLRSQGYDGVIVGDLENNPDGAVVVALGEPSQIKSAIGNAGTFDPAKPSILAQMAYKIAGQEGSATTQVATTIGSYRKAAAKIAERLGANARVLDYGAGLGLGSDAMRDSVATVDSYEPFPERWRGQQRPTFTSTEGMGSDYDGLVNLNVLNVLEPALRDAVLRDMLGRIKPGGVAVIGTRGWTGDVATARNTEPADEPKAVWVLKGAQRVYQKGFDGAELADYVRSIAGGGFDVQRVQGIASNAVIITRRESAQSLVAQTPTRHPFTGEPVQPRKDAAREAREMVRRVAGADVQVIISETIAVESAMAASTAANPDAADLQGAYDLVDDVIEVSLAANDPTSTAFHEAWHRIEMRLLNSRELALLQREVGRLKAWLKTTPYAGLIDIDALPDYEVTAYAAQAYEAAKNGRFPYAGGVHVGVRAAFDKLLRFLARVRNVLRGQGFAIAEDLFQAAIDGKMANRRPTDAGKRQHFGAKAADAVAQPAYHGTHAANIERFTTEKIGTGEGSQVYGWGLYFAQRKGIAEHYQKTVGGNALVTPDGTRYPLQTGGDFDAFSEGLANWSDENFPDHLNKRFPPMVTQRLWFREPFDIIREFLFNEATFKKARAIIESKRDNADEEIRGWRSMGYAQIEVPTVTELAKAYSLGLEALDFMEKAGWKESTGALYEVDVPEDHELMIWDAPWSEQPEGVRKKLDDLYMQIWNHLQKHPNIYTSPPSVIMERLTGEDFYSKLGAANMWSDKAVSEAIAAAGVPGHRYLDNATRGRPWNDPNATFNYVIYQDDAVRSHKRIAQVGVKKAAPVTVAQAYEQEMTGDRTILGYNAKAGFTYLRRKLQDRFLPILNLQRAAEQQTGAPVPDHLNVHMAEANYHRVAELREMFYEDRVQPIVDAMREAGISQTEMDDFLKAKHAQERNAEMARRGSLKGAGAKWTDAFAQSELARIAADPRGADFERIADMVYAMNKATRDRLVKHGLMDADDRDAWEKMYQFYVPLRGFEEDPDEASPSGLGRRFAVAGKEAKTAYGRESEADSPLVYSIMQGTTAIIRAEKVKVARVMHRFMNQYPDEDLYERYTGRWDQKLDRQGQIVRHWVPAAREYDPKIRETLFPVKFGSKTVYWKIHDRDLLKAMTGLGEEQQVGELGRMWLGAARFYAKLLTQWNVDFTLPNFSRDLQTAVANISSLDEQLPKGLRTGIALDAIKNVPLILREIRTGKTSHATRYYDEFRAMGGKINFLAGLDVKSIKSDIQAKLSDPSALMKAGKSVMQLIGDINTAVENATRLAVYTQLREAGYSKEKAANAAREVTVNFNRRGEWGTFINGAYLFFNASIQSSTRILSGLFSRSPKIRRRMAGIMVGIVAAGLLGDILNAWLGNGDDDEYDGLPDFVADRNIVFMIPGTDGKYVTLPLAYGYNVPYVLGREIGKVLRGKHSPAEAAAKVTSAVVNSFSPLGENATWLQFLSPTLLDPVAQHSENTDWTGRPIKPRFKQEGKPEAYNATLNAADWAKRLAETLNDATGGSVGRPGFLDMSPDVIEHYVAAIGGGAGATVARTVKSGWNLAKGEEIAAKDIPIVRRFYGDAGAAAARMDEFYTAFNRVNQAAYEVKTLRKNGEHAAARDVQREFRAEISVSDQFKKARERLSDLRERRIKVERDGKLSPAARRQQLDAIDRQQLVTLERALAALKRAMERQQ